MPARDSNPRTLGYKPDSLTIRPRLYNLLADDYSEQLWKNIGSFINENIQQDVSITFKGIVLGHYESDSTKSNSWCIIYLKKIL